MTVVGCGTVVPEGDRAASSYWVSGGGATALFDCGPGAVQALARLRLPWDTLTDLVVTHFHADHVGALPGLFFAFRHALRTRRTQPLAVWGPDGTRNFFEKLAGAYGDFILNPGFPLKFREMAPGCAGEVTRGVRLSFHDTPHTAESVACRLDGPQFSFGYTGDTGPSATLGAFMRGVSVLLCECSCDDSDRPANHLSPGEVAAVASSADPRLLVLTHIYPNFRLEKDVTELVRQSGYAGEAYLAKEGLRATLTNG